MPAIMPTICEYEHISCTQAWLRAKEANDFSLFAPALKAWNQALREKAEAVDPSRCGPSWLAPTVSWLGSWAVG